ncbi:hypothetical protein D187_004208 [Cystobacter fuscus DSM 2262]|uniref:Abortive phage infection protein C-terminal domain-containing protein n=1 Tax=Cystobacter fuscus (strain ATCC 25194 / DSM 2262 / NBRC 100088 / M29) TaxID=1242864 RepID=S9P4R9_CYSF2|nr:AIPR family protein [Cystobacter fuscus]EPX58171.1 hypothetical protein D187_004208 [Cystobacter fuscus DSM 2262]
MSASAVLKAFEHRKDLAKYGSNALILFALQLKHHIDDIHAVATDALTDGSNDKKCDLVYVDRGSRLAVIAQGYFSKQPKKEAPANKASDLNTALTWLLTTSIKSLPAKIRPAATDLREALKNKEIDVLEIWYVHNCAESVNVDNELASVASGVKVALNSAYKDSGCDEVQPLEVGLNTLGTWYRSIETAVLVSDEFTVQVPGGYAITEGKWAAFSTAVPAKWLYELYKKHQTDLFSANVRDYLGSRKSDSNINHGIKESAEQKPSEFWAFNNGITALVNDFIEPESKNKILTIKGISIVNGAQTTGAIGSLDNPPVQNAMVPARFIKCTSPDLVQEIVRYNNSQNKVAPADFRSTDAIQERLRQEFAQRPSKISYLGGRRGGAQDAIQRPGSGNHIPSDTAAQSLTAFHGNPSVAYSRKSDIWESDKYYSSVFSDHTHAEHILFVCALHQVISKIKMDIFQKKEEELTETDRENLNFFRLRGSIHMFMAAVGACMETILGHTVPSKFTLRFRKSPKLSEAEQAWRPVLDCCIPFQSVLRPPLEGSLTTTADINQPITQFRSFVNSTRSSNKKIYDEFAAKVTAEPWITKKK